MSNHYDSIIPFICPGYKRALSEFARHTANAHSVFELGIGTGNVASAILQKNSTAHYHGIDIDNTTLCIAGKKLSKYNCTLQCGDFSNIIIPRIDAVVSSLSIHHLEHNRQAELFKRIAETSSLFLHFELIAPENKEEEALYANLLEQHVRSQTAAIGIDCKVLQALKEESSQKDKPIKLSEHRHIFDELGSQIEIIFQEYCFVFYKAHMPKN